MGERRSVAIQIFGHEYRIKTDADPAGVERLARMVDDTMARIRDRTGAVDSLDLAVMAALNLANDLLSAQNRERASASQTVSADDLRSLRHTVDRALADA